MEDHIDKAHWSDFLTDFAKTHHGYEARIEIIGHTFGDQEEAAWLPFAGISYDQHHNQIFITVGGLNSRYPAHLTHTIDAPRMLRVRRMPEGEIRSILIVSPDKPETLLHLRRQPQIAA